MTTSEPAPDDAELERLRAEVEMKSDRATLFREAYRDLRSGVRMALGLPDVLASIDEQHEQLHEIEAAAIAIRGRLAEAEAAIARVEALCAALGSRIKFDTAVIAKNLRRALDGER